MSRDARTAIVFGAALLASSLVDGPQSGEHLAYIGPGAGFAFLGSFFTLAGGLVLSLLSFLAWPFRMVRRALRRRRLPLEPRVRRAVFLGLDGLDPGVTERLMDEGKLPNLSRLRSSGTYSRLRTTCPPLSPVAWSTFATGVNPAGHDIFDFLRPHPRTHTPELAASRVGPPHRFFRIGRWRIPLSKPELVLRRKSRAFWTILSEYAIHSTVLRVPVTFPPEEFDGFQLSAMATPDLRGTQGSFTFFSTRTGDASPLTRHGAELHGILDGPEDVFLTQPALLRLPFRILGEPGHERLEIGGESHALNHGEYTPWIALRFRTAAGPAIRGIARFLLTESGGDTSLYVTPIQIDPEHPALPISHPGIYAAYLAKLFGSYATVGMAEDTWALNEGVIGKRDFLAQTWDIYREREQMFLHALERTRHGVVACVFDTSDRIQHMFHRGDDDAVVIEDLYRRMDELAGKAMAHADSDTALFVLSDHGFCSFRRGVNLNAWLAANGYLVTQGDGSIDWKHTRAYVLGLTGLYLNVPDGTKATALRTELCQLLERLCDPATGVRAIRRAYIARETLKGPYLESAPDLIIGWEDGYRTSWDAALGKVSREIFEDNTKCWSGDHCVDPSLVPGVLFSNLRWETSDPGIEDMAPTALRLFGVQPPAWMEGRPLIPVA